MSTLVCFHAHPDDEAIATGGLMAKAKAEGHRVFLVLATRGECGIPNEGVLAEGETLAEVREREANRAAAILGIDGLAFLDYKDSGMIGEDTNDDPTCFWQADVEEAATRLAALLGQLDTNVLTIYDPHGGYGHPDHIQVHRVGARAAQLADVPQTYWATMNRTKIEESRNNPEFAALFEEAVESIDQETPEQPEPAHTDDEFGLPDADITHAIDVSAYTGLKREAMAAHRSQIDDQSFFLAMPPEIFGQVFGTEWFVDPKHSPRVGDYGTDLFASA